MVCMPRSETVNLENSLLFQGLPRDVLARIEDLARVDEFKSGERIFREGEPAVDLYILREGKVELTYTLPNDPDTDIRINDVSPGEVFAWSALAKGDTAAAKQQAQQTKQVVIYDRGTWNRVERHAELRRPRGDGERGLVNGAAGSIALFAPGSLPSQPGADR